MPHKDNSLLRLFSELCINAFRNTLFKPNRATVIFLVIFFMKILANKKIVVPLQRKTEKQGRLAQLVQSICLTSRGSAVRIRQRPQEEKLIKVSPLFYYTSPFSRTTHAYGKFI